MSYVLILCSVVLSGLAQVFMKMGTMKIQMNFLNIITNVHILSGFAFYALSAVIWIYAISKIPISIAYPMASLGYVIVFILSYFVLNESISGVRIMGLLIIIFGVVVVAKS